MIDNKLINKTFSNKIKVASLILIIMVLYLHSYNISDDTAFYFTSTNFFPTINIYFQNILSQGIARVAVPLFFMISGFLFFKEGILTINLYKKKISSRFFTLLIPYIFWSFFVITIYFILQSIPHTAQYFKNTLIKDLTFIDLITKIFLNPINYPLWFLRDLIYIVLISPIFYFFIKKSPLITLSILLCLWLYGLNDGTDLSFFKSEPFFFFAFGSYLAIHKQNTINFKIPNKTFYISLALYFILLVYKTYLITHFIDSDYIVILHKTSILIGIFVFWTFLDRIKSYKLLSITKFTFLFYVFHEPMNIIIRKGVYSLFGKTVGVSLLLYISIPILIVITLITVSFLANKIIPKFYSIILGNRIK